MKIPGEDHVHVHPDTAVVPENQKANGVAVHPSPLVEHAALLLALAAIAGASRRVRAPQPFPEQALELGPACEVVHVHLANRDILSPFLQDSPDVLVGVDDVGAICPDDKL